MAASDSKKRDADTNEEEPAEKKQKVEASEDDLEDDSWADSLPPSKQPVSENKNDKVAVNDKTTTALDETKQKDADTVVEGKNSSETAAAPEKKVENESKASSEEKGKPQDIGDALTIVVKSINYCVDEEQFELDFSEHGEIDDLKFIGDRGMAYVTYCSKEAVLAALKMDEDEYYGRKLSVQIARESGIFEIFVKGFPDSATEDEVKAHFSSKCGEVFKISMRVDKDGKSTGSAFVKFNSKDALDKALALDGGGFQNARIDVSVAETKKGKGKGKGKDKGKGKGKGKGKAKGKGKGNK